MAALSFLGFGAVALFMRASPRSRPAWGWAPPSWAWPPRSPPMSCSTSRRSSPPSSGWTSRESQRLEEKTRGDFPFLVDGQSGGQAWAGLLSPRAEVKFQAESANPYARYGSVLGTFLPTTLGLVAAWAARPTSPRPRCCGWSWSVWPSRRCPRSTPSSEDLHLSAPEKPSRPVDVSPKIIPAVDRGRAARRMDAERLCRRAAGCRASFRQPDLLVERAPRRNPLTGKEPEAPASRNLPRCLDEGNRLPGCWPKTRWLPAK